MDRPSIGLGDTPRSSTYTRVYNEAYSRYYNQLCRPSSESENPNPELMRTCHLLADCDAFRADARERETRWSGADWRLPSNPFAFDVVSSANQQRTSYPILNHNPYPTTRAPTEADLWNRSYWNQRAYNYTHENWRAQDRRQDWNRWMYGSP
jgi:hypothetical protein